MKFRVIFFPKNFQIKLDHFFHLKLHCVFPPTRGVAVAGVAVAGVAGGWVEHEPVHDSLHVTYRTEQPATEQLATEQLATEQLQSSYPQSSQACTLSSSSAPPPVGAPVRITLSPDLCGQ